MSLNKGITTCLSFDRAEQGLLDIRILFFHQRTTTALQPHSVNGPTLQKSIQLAATPPNRLEVHTSDLGQESVAAMAHLTPEEVFLASQEATGQEHLIESSKSTIPTSVVVGLAGSALNTASNLSY